MQNNSHSNAEKIFFKILSLILAIALWLIILHEINPEMIEEYKGVEINYEFGENKCLVILDYYPKKMDINIKGKRNDIIYLKEKNINSYVDLTDASVGNNDYNIIVSMPEQEKFEIVKQEIASINLNIDKYIVKNYRISGENIEVENLDDSLSYKIIEKNNYVSANLKLPSTYLAEINEKIEIFAKFDLKGLGVGVHDLPYEVFYKADLDENVNDFLSLESGKKTYKILIFNSK